MIRLENPTITNSNLGTVVGSGSNTQIAYWSAGTTLTGSNDLIFTASGLESDRDVILKTGQKIIFDGA